MKIPKIVLIFPGRKLPKSKDGKVFLIDDAILVLTQAVAELKKAKAGKLDRLEIAENSNGLSLTIEPPIKERKLKRSELDLEPLKLLNSAKPKFNTFKVAK